MKPVSGSVMLRVLLVAVSVAFVWILLPFYGTILWGAIIALLFAPLNRWLLPRMGQRRTLAALITMLAAIVIVVLPAALVATSLAREASQLYARIESGELKPALMLRGLFEALPSWLTDLLARFGLGNFDLIQRKLTQAVTQGSQFIATQTFNLGQDALGLVVSLAIALYLAFFLVRDGGAIMRAIRMAIPLPPDDKQELLEQFGTVLRATVKGNLVVALVQGALGGLAFWVLGVNAALLWAVLMAVLSLLPAVGAGLVWGPVAIWLFATGEVWQSVGLVLYGVLVIGLVDNVLRPLLVGKDTGMPDYLVLISTVGGISVMGINGFVIGPVVAAMFVAVWGIQTATRVKARAAAMSADEVATAPNPPPHSG
ncbi:MAG: AI-2E family transporter [Hydrogenophaga sp.]|uniref:AI-2E family transporter n=2 Tax=Hydrogenophaga sp. TaxID=1904254 RepID=UPI001DF1D36F|nr:AI-2E family transporter [Hydrogenophaga sp.]MBW0171703.1 AI-2E family transporter [Hydrogenophaga sp.]MBW0184003.1 AI-2E family transporter [Hydrogenophaga sp.]